MPKHIGIIMDGNGRWAQQRGLERTEGHKKGAEVFDMICDHAYDIGLQCVTFYAFSTENWKRSPAEVGALMKLFDKYLNKAKNEKEEREGRGFCLRFIGDTGAIPPDLSELCDETEGDIKGSTKTVINIALNYGGRDEILNSVKKIAQRVKDGELSPDDITQDDIEKGLYTYGDPPLDLVIRPSGEYRLSNFMIWQSAYAEFWFSDILWPDFTCDDLDRAICNYAKRNRRFGGVEK